MNREQQVKLDWKFALSAIAATVALGIGSSSVQASPEAEFNQKNFQIAQVGVRSRINSPTPLNLRPRTHIPLPTRSRSSDYYRQHRGYYPQHRGYNRHDQYGYGHDHDCNHRGHHRGRNRRRGTVIIINPASSSSYSNYNYTDIGGHIRIIRK